LRKQLPRQLVLVNTEQPSTHWFALARECFAAAYTIWDINYESSQFLASQGFPCGYLPLGYVRDFELLNKVDELPEHYGTCFLEPEIRGRSSLHEEFANRPMDILFTGYSSPRRQKFFAEAASVLSRYRCYLHFSDGSSPIIPGQNTYMDTPTVVGLAQRSKIVLNVHQGEDQYFEWHRMIMLGVWQRALVVSETCGMAPPFRPGVDFVSAPLEDITDVLQYYLSSSQGAKEAGEIVQRAAATLTEKCRLDAVLSSMIGADNIRHAETWRADMMPFR
jgi:hypothetical protein